MLQIDNVNCILQRSLVLWKKGKVNKNVLNVERGIIIQSKEQRATEAPWATSMIIEQHFVATSMRNFPSTRHSNAMRCLTTLHSLTGMFITPRPKNSLIVPKRSRLCCNAVWNMSCRSADSSCALRKARILLLLGAHLGHSASSPST